MYILSVKRSKYRRKFVFSRNKPIHSRNDTHPICLQNDKTLLLIPSSSGTSHMHTILRTLCKYLLCIHMHKTTCAVLFKKHSIHCGKRNRSSFVSSCNPYIQLYVVYIHKHTRAKHSLYSLQRGLAQKTNPLV